MKGDSKAAAASMSPTRSATQRKQKIAIVPFILTVKAQQLHPTKIVRQPKMIMGMEACCNGPQGSRKVAATAGNEDI